MQEQAPERADGNASKPNIGREAKPQEQHQPLVDRLSPLVLVLLGLLIGSQVYTWVGLQKLMTLIHHRDVQSVAAQEALQKEIDQQRAALNQALQQIVALDQARPSAIAARRPSGNPGSVVAAHEQLQQTEASEKPVPDQQELQNRGTGRSIGVQVRPVFARRSVSRDASATAQDLSAAHQDVDATKNGLGDETAGNLGTKRSQSGSGVSEGVAHGHNEIEKLRKLGERDYVEFTLVRSPARQEVVPGISLQLKKVDVKKSRCALNIYADNYELPLSQAMNEPVLFPIRAGWQSAEVELVINEVERDRVAGYLSALKGVLVAGK